MARCSGASLAYQWNTGMSHAVLEQPAVKNAAASNDVTGAVGTASACAPTAFGLSVGIVDKWCSGNCHVCGDAEQVRTDCALASNPLALCACGDGASVCPGGGSARDCAVLCGDASEPLHSECVDSCRLHC
jgi:hypothetical protein